MEAMFSVTLTGFHQGGVLDRRANLIKPPLCPVQPQPFSLRPHASLVIALTVVSCTLTFYHVLNHQNAVLHRSHCPRCYRPGQRSASRRSQLLGGYPAYHPSYSFLT